MFSILTIFQYLSSFFLYYPYVVNFLHFLNANHRTLTKETCLVVFSVLIMTAWTVSCPCRARCVQRKRSVVPEATEFQWAGLQSVVNEGVQSEECHRQTYASFSVAWIFNAGAGRATSDMDV